MKIVRAVAAGGAIGASARCLLVSGIGRWLGDGFSWSAWVVNIVGCLIMGALTELMTIKWNFGAELRAPLTFGILVGFTAFSGFTLDTAVLNETAAFGASTAYVLAFAMLSIGGFDAGLRTVRQSSA